MNHIDTSVWVNLKVVSSLQPFQRLNTRNKLFQINHYKYIPEFVQRWWEGSTRESDFGRVVDVFQMALQYPENSLMQVHLQNSLRGLAALQKTYETDTTMIARLDTLIEQVKAVTIKEAEAVNECGS